MIRLFHAGSRCSLVNVFRATREGAFVVLEGVVQIGAARPVQIKILCCRGSERHLYPRHVYTLHRRDTSTWYVEAGPHVVQDGERSHSVVHDAIELCGVPEDLDFFELPETP